jgi:3-deoxy-D-manno-octulosonate 8-phosphate phosphatase (KDO 8-P phosphatase)
MLEKFATIDTFIFDIDGVLTDGTLLVLPDGVMARRMNIKDGYALQLAIKRGYKVAIISGGDSIEVKDRMAKLGITDVFMKVEDKLKKLTDYLSEKNSTLSTVLYMGDDIPDAAVMKAVALPTCPADAVADIKAIATYISPFKGGEGCARDVIEKTMRLRDDWYEDASVVSK